MGAAMRRATICALVLLWASAAFADQKPRKLHRLWVGFTFGFTTVFHPSGDDVCASSEWVCAQNDGPRYSQANTGAHVDAGFGGLATSQMVTSFDVALTDGLLVGVRAGFYFHPTNVNVVDFGTYFSIYEARVTWVLGHRPLTSSWGFRPYALFGVGLADFSAPARTSLTTTNVIGTQAIDAWRVAGPGFITTGLGVRFGNERFAVMLAPLKVTSAFGSGGAIAFMPELALMTSLF